MKAIEKVALIKLLKREPYKSQLDEEVTQEYIRQKEKQHSLSDRAKDVKVLGSRIDDMEQSVAKLDQKMDESHHRLESMLKLLLAKGVSTPLEDEALAVASQEDNSNVHAPCKETTLTATPQTMPSPKRDTTVVADKGDAVDSDNKEDSEEVRKEEVLGGGGSKEVLGGVCMEKGPKSLAIQPLVGETLAREKGTEVAVQKERATATNKTKKTPKVVDPEKLEQVNCANACT